MIEYVCEECDISFADRDSALAHIIEAAEQDAAHGVAVIGGNPDELRQAATEFAEAIKRSSAEMGAAVFLVGGDEHNDDVGSLLGLLSDWSDEEWRANASRASELTSGLITAVHKSTNLGRDGRPEWNEFDVATRELVTEASSSPEFARLVMLMLSGYAAGVIDLVAQISRVDPDEAMARIGLSWSRAGLRWFIDDDEEGEE
jgi:hypothetical protein